MIQIDFHPEATRDLEDSADWYLIRSAAAAMGFAHAVDLALQKISEAPERYPIIRGTLRACNLGNYPFQIIYRQHDCRILVIAVAHAKRRPGYWRTRLSDQP